MSHSPLPDDTVGASIGQVVHLLAPDFPELSVSKIRYLQAEGLIQPQRQGSGYRVFSPDDVDRLRFVLTAQRDRFWPLRVIRDVLERLDSGLPVPEVDPPNEPVSDAAAPPAPSEPVLEGGPTPLAAGTGAALRPGGRPTVRMTPAELRSATGLDIPTYSALTTFGLLRLDPVGRHRGDDLDVARAAAALAAYGIEARHLRLFRVAADREIGLAEQVLEPLRRRRARGAPGADPEEVQAQVLAHGLALHTALVRSGLSRPG